MATITIPKVRKETDVMMYVKLTDNGVTVDWTSLSEVVAFMYSNEQDCIAGQCETAIAAGDPSTLNVRYTTMAPQFLGVNSLLIRCTYDGMQKSFDVPVLEFVDRTAEATGQVTLDDPELPVSIEVTDVDTSLLDEAIAAALDAAAAAAAAAALVPLDVLTQCQEATIACQDATAHASPIIGENGNWKYYDPETGEYVDSELPSRGIQGPQGEQGPQGIQGNTGSSVDYPFELVNNRTTDDATKALSAAEGKRLGDDLSQLDQEVNGVNETLDDSNWIHKNIQSSLATVSDDDWRLSPAIRVVKGTTFEINTAGNNLWCLVSCDANGTIQSGLIRLYGDADSNTLYTLTIQEDGYVRVSYKKSVAGAYAKMINEGLKALPEELGIKKSLTPEITWVDGSYVNYRTGSIVTSTFASVSNPIDVSQAAGRELFYSRLCDTGTGLQGMAFYDANGQYIIGVAPIEYAPEMGIQLYSTIVPPNAKSARFSCPTANKASFELYFFYLLKSKVEEIDSQVQDMKAVVEEMSTDLASTIREEINISWISGEYYDGSKTVKSNVNYSRAVIELTNFDNLEKVEVNLYSSGARIYLFLEDADHNTIWKLLIDSNTVYPLAIDIPEIAAYLLLSNRSLLGVGTADAIMKGDASWIRPSLEGLLSKTPESFLKGKKISFLGDSMTYGSGATHTNKRYSTLFSNRCGAIENNLGVQGSALATNAVGRSDSTRFAARATAANLAGSDLIIIFGGTNDFSYDSKAIGDLFVETSITPTERIGSKELTAPSDTDTFAGALHELINLVRTNCPNVPIMFMTPINRGSYTGIAGRPTSKQSNVNGNFLYEFVDAIKKICAFYSIPVLDLSGSELDFSNAAIAANLSYDNLHPNDKGYAIIAELLYRFVEQNIII